MSLTASICQRLRQPLATAVLVAGGLFIPLTATATAQDGIVREAIEREIRERVEQAFQNRAQAEQEARERSMPRPDDTRRRGPERPRTPDRPRMPERPRRSETPRGAESPRMPAGRAPERPMDRPEVHEHNGERSHPGGDREAHVREAIEHLRIAGWHDVANVLDQRLHGQPMRPDNGPQPDHHGPWGRFAEQQMEQVHDMLGHVRGTIEQLERRTQDTDEIARAVDEAHRKVEDVARHLEHRTEDLERQLHRKIEEFEHHFSKHMQEFERHIDRLSSDVDERLDDLAEHLDDDDDDEDDDDEEEEEDDDEDDDEDEDEDD